MKLTADCEIEYDIEHRKHYLFTRIYYEDVLVHLKRYDIDNNQLDYYKRLAQSNNKVWDEYAHKALPAI